MIDYYKQGNRLLTRSKILDYLKSPEYFYRKHIECSIEQESSDVFLIGGVVDELLTEDKSKRVYQGHDEEGKAKRRTEKLVEEYEAKGITLITETMEEEILNIAMAVEKCSAWKIIKEKGTFQAVISVGLPKNEHFDILAGRPDFYWIEGDTCYLGDLKTTKSIEPIRYYYNSLSYKYHWQMAIYGKLIRDVYPEVKKIIYRHIQLRKQGMYIM